MSDLPPVDPPPPVDPRPRVDPGSQLTDQHELADDCADWRDKLGYAENEMKLAQGRAWFKELARRAARAADRDAAEAEAASAAADKASGITHWTLEGSGTDAEGNWMPAVHKEGDAYRDAAARQAAQAAHAAAIKARTEAKAALDAYNEAGGDAAHEHVYEEANALTDLRDQLAGILRDCEERQLRERYPDHPHTVERPGTGSVAGDSHPHTVERPGTGTAKVGGRPRRIKTLGALALLVIAGGAAFGIFAATHPGQSQAQGWSLGSPITLKTQTFVVTHQQKDSGGLIGSDAVFRDRIYVGPAVTVARDRTQPDKSHRDELQIHLNDKNDVRDQVLEQKNPGGLAEAAWLQDLMPLPGAPFQAITHGIAVFDNGTAEADRATSFEIVILIPHGATHLRALILTFDWLDQGRNLTFAAVPPNSSH